MHTLLQSGSDTAHIVSVSICVVQYRIISLYVLCCVYLYLCAADIQSRELLRSINCQQRTNIRGEHQNNNNNHKKNKK